jgi:o-succinylbenzoate---CoA ligase
MSSLSHWSLSLQKLPADHPAAACWSYVLPNVDGALAWLRSLGVSHGCRLGLAGANTPETAALLQAAPLAGATTVLFNRRLTTNELLQQRDQSSISLLIADKNHPLANYSRIIPPTFANDELGDVTPLRPADPAFIIFTSGTSGQAKAARLSWSAIRSASDSATAVLCMDPKTTWLGCLPLDHIGGASIVLRAGRCGNNILLCERFDASAINQLLETMPVHGMSMVPTMLLRLLNDRQSRPWPATLRILLTGGGPLSSDLIARSTALGLPPHQTYGLTEAASQVTTLLPAEATAHPGSAGRPLPGTELKIIDGVIAIRGPSLFDGYESDGQLSEPHAAHSWFMTGDIGQVDNYGYLTVHARRSDLIISGGENVYPAEIEAVLERHPAIAEAGVCGISDPEWGQRVAAVVVARTTPLSNAELDAWCTEHLAAFKCPKLWRWAKTLPRTATGKLQRHLLSTKANEFG